MTARRRIEIVIAAALAAGTVAIAAARTEEDQGRRHLTLEQIGTFGAPVHIAQPPGSDAPLFVVEKSGRLRVVYDGEVIRRPFLDIRDRVKSKGAEQGMLSVAFPPHYERSRLLYVAYTDRRDDLRIVEFRRSPSDALRVDRPRGRLVLRIPQPTEQHQGGLLLFGPDGRLYIGSGDGGPSGDPDDRGQRLDTLHGKILRINPRRRGKRPYTVPGDNPFVGRRGRGAIFAYGLRNPWRFSFDRATGTMAIGDVGQDRFEEVNLVPLRRARGANFGWAAYEGFAVFRGGVPKRRTVQPVLVYPRGPGCSVIGGYVVRDRRLAHVRGREVVGTYVFGDYCTGQIHHFPVRPGGKAGRDRPLRRFRVPRLTSFGEDRSGRIYMASQDGPVYRLTVERR